MQASSMVWHLWGFVMTVSDILDRVLESAEILQEFSKKSLPQWALQKELPTCIWGKHGSFVYALFPPRSRWDCTLLGNYTACSGNSLPTFWDNLSVPSSRAKEVIITTCCVISQKSTVSSTLWQKPEITNCKPVWGDNCTSHPEIRKSSWILDPWRWDR